MRLVLAEKPSVARDLAQIMDPGAKRGEGHLRGGTAAWTWALGHLAELAPPESYEPRLKGHWTLTALPVLPEQWRLRPREGRQDQLAVIRRLLSQADELVVATDAGREGELIAGYILELCPFQGRIRRLWLSETTPAAVRAAFAALREPALALEAAARARAQADWLVGMNCTMALSAKHGGLWSAGRVQTPTLALLCAREAEVRAFRAQDYFVVLATFEADGARYTGRWFRGQVDRLPTAGEAEALAARVQGQRGTVSHLERRRTREQPPRLLHLTDLQRAANARHGMTAAATLKAAQALYETHRALTYPRTDSRHVSGETFGTFPSRMRAVAAARLPSPLGELAGRLLGHLPDPGKRVVDDSKVSDHHALLPTAQAPDLGRLSTDEARVYELVVRRFLAALLPAAEWDETNATTGVQGETFRSRARVLAVPGWREAEPPAQSRTRRRGQGRGPADAVAAEQDEPEEQAEDDEPEAGDLSGLGQGMAVRCLEARAEQRKTKPPARYTEASLLRAMETAGRLVDDEALAEAMRERGLGTPATRAAIIETLVHRDYVRREKKSLVPTPRGETLVGVAPAELRSVDTTGEWEARLLRIGAGQDSAASFLAGITELTRRIVADVSSQERTSVPNVAGRTVVGRCPRCGGDVVESDKGFGCANWRPEHGGCRWVLWKKVAGKTLTAGQARELLERGESARPLRGFRSTAGKSFAARLRLDRDSGRVRFLFEEAPATARPGASAGDVRSPRTSPASQPTAGRGQGQAPVSPDGSDRPGPKGGPRHGSRERGAPSGPAPSPPPGRPGASTPRRRGSGTQGR